MVPGDFAGMHTRKNVDMEAALDCPTMLGGKSPPRRSCPRVSRLAAPGLR
jgi:hypothetical protein